MKKPNQFNKKDWNNFFDQLLIKNNCEVFNNFFAKNHTMKMNNYEYNDNEFIEAIKRFKNNNQIDQTKSNVIMLDFFYTDDNNKMAVLYRTNIYYINNPELTSYLVSGFINFDHYGKINHLFNITYIEHGPKNALF